MRRSVVAFSLLLAACSGTDATTSPGAGSSGTTGGSSSTSSGGNDGASTSSSSSSSSSTSSGGSSGTAGTLAPGKTTRTIKAAGKDRSVIVVAPAAVATKKLPLVIALHGNGDTSQSFISVTTPLEKLADTEGFVLAAPQGIAQTITIGNQTINVSWDAYRDAAQGNLDIPLLDAIRSELGATGSIDETKVFTFGYSQGGYLSFRYGMDTAAQLSCTAVIAAANPLGPQLTSAAARKIPVALQIGTNDGAINQARSTKSDLEGKQFPLDYREIQGAGHVPFPGDPKLPLGYCLGQNSP